MKKLLNLICGIGIVVLSTISCTFAYTQEQREAYEWAYKYKITTQPTIEAAKLEWNITRQAFAKMIVNYLENVVWINQTSLTSCNFPDENKITNDLKAYTKKTCSYNIMWSNWSKFNPTNSLSRAQLWTVLSRILWWDENNTNGNNYYIYHLNALKQNWVMNKIDNPQKSTKRWDVLIMLKRIYDKFGSNIYMNSWNNSVIYDTAPDNTINLVINPSNNSSTSELLSNSNVIYTWKDWRKYVYDDNFLNILKNTADKKWEKDLYEYLKIEASYYEDWLDQISNLDLDDLTESLGINEDVDPDSLTEKEKQELLKKVKDGIGKIVKENKNRNEEYIEKLEKVTKNISNDKFWLKEKYKKTKWFIDATVSFLNLYSETALNLLKLSLTSENWKVDDWEWMALAFTIIWTALAYQGEAQEYQWYIEEWATNTIKLLWWELDASNVKYNEKTVNNASSKVSSAQTRARDVERKSNLSQLQSAVITSQWDKWMWPWMNKWGTEWISVSVISGELMHAWMSYIPTDPTWNKKVSWLWSTNTVDWWYSYLIIKRNWVLNWWFVLMAKMELAWWWNWVVCENKSWLDNWYITNDTELTDIHPCQKLTKWDSCSAKACTYKDNDELRYIVMY